MAGYSADLPDTGYPVIKKPDTGYPEIRQKSISGRIISGHRISGPTLIINPICTGGKGEIYNRFWRSDFSNLNIINDYLKNLFRMLFEDLFRRVVLILPFPAPAVTSRTLVKKFGFLLILFID